MLKIGNMQITREVVVTEGPAPSEVLTLTMYGAKKVVGEPTRGRNVVGNNSTHVNVNTSVHANTNNCAQEDANMKVN